MTEEPAPRQIDSWFVAEENAAEWMRYWGHVGAACTAGGADGGIDVRSRTSLAQVKYEAVQVGSPAVQKLVGARGREHHLRLLFFTGAGYARPAVDYANQMDVALFKYDLAGRPTAVNQAARDVVRVSSLEPDAPASVQAAVWAAAAHPRKMRKRGWWQRSSDVLPSLPTDASLPMSDTLFWSVLETPGVEEALALGKKVPAIKSYRAANRVLGLRESKDIIDAVAADSRYRRQMLGSRNA